jgi:hypothetical protein
MLLPHTTSPPPPRHLPTCDTGCLSLRVERCLKEYPSSRLFRLAQKGATSLLNCNDRCPNKRTGRQAGARGCDAGEILSHSRCSSPLPPAGVFLLTEGIQCVGGHKVHIRPKDSQLMLIGTLEVWRKPPCSTWQMHASTGPMTHACWVFLLFAHRPSSTLPHLADVSIIWPHDLCPHTPHRAAWVCRVFYAVDQSKALTILGYGHLHMLEHGAYAAVCCAVSCCAVLTGRHDAWN